MTNPTIAVPVVSPAEARELIALRRSVRRVHKSVPPQSPVRQASADLSTYLYRLHRRGVPLKVLAKLVGLSHQAVRVRVRSAKQAEGSGPVEFSLNGSPLLSEPTRTVVLVADAGVHRRLHVYDPPQSVGAAQLALMPQIPLLEARDKVATWLETEQAASEPTSVTSTPLRVPPAVYLPRKLVNTVLVSLTTED
jgi:hypothetical protein